MGIERLDYFLSAVRCRSFTKAAQECGVVPSTISQQIASLEKEIGFPLFSRKGRSVALTRQGELFYQKAQDLQAEYRSAVLQAQMAKRLQLGVHSERALSELPDALRQGMEALQAIGVEIVIEQFTPEVARDKLCGGECDLYIGYDSKKWLGICKIYFSEKPVMLYSRDKDEKAKTLKELMAQNATIYVSSELWESLCDFYPAIGERCERLRILENPDMVLLTAKANNERALLVADHAQQDLLPILDGAGEEIKVCQTLFWNDKEEKEILQIFFREIQKDI